MRTFPTPVLPATRPKKLAEPVTVEAYLRSAGFMLAGDQTVVLFVRGYYLNDQGDKGKNDHNTYDDAAAIVRIRGGRAASVWTFNANTDARAESGLNPSGNAWPALEPGVHAYRFGFHRDHYLALKPFTTVQVRRAGKLEWNASINGHAGGDSWTYSEGCLTVYHAQYGPQTKSLTRTGEGFIDRLWRECDVTHQGGGQTGGSAVFRSLAGRAGERPVPVVLVDEAAFRVAR